VTTVFVFYTMQSHRRSTETVSVISATGYSASRGDIGIELAAAATVLVLTSGVSTQQSIDPEVV